MKKSLASLLILLLIISSCYSIERKMLHTYNSDYSLFPSNQYKNQYVKQLSSGYKVNYCVQSNIRFPRKEAKGYDCAQILKKLDQMGGLDKECYGVSYIDGDSGERKPIFKKAKYDADNGKLYVKDKAAGGLHFDVKIDRYQNKDKLYVVSAIINKKSDNIFVRGIKKNEAEIFVFMQESEDYINVYSLIQCSYSPKEHKYFKTIVEKAVSARVVEIQNWFYRMMCGV